MVMNIKNHIIGHLSFIMGSSIWPLQVYSTWFSFTFLSPFLEGVFLFFKISKNYSSIDKYDNNKPKNKGNQNEKNHINNDS